MAKKSAKKPVAGQRALVIGVSDYPAPISKLPAVAADVREMAKLLGSKHGAFSKSGVNVLTDSKATRQQILEDLHKTFSGATSDDTIFVYIAGHGAPEGSDYYFIAHDTDIDDLPGTGVPLKAIKDLFDDTPCRRVFLWLDFCHSGGILARRPVADDLPAISRALSVVKGHGKVIVAACTSSQSAYEDPSIGHGLFTHALLQGLRGEAKSAQGEVTALSLYEFIDHQVANRRQQPVFFGEMTGRIVLMHYPDRSGASAEAKTTHSTTGKVASPKKAAGTWVMLGDHYFLAEVVRQQPQGKVEIVVVPDGGDEEAAIASLRPTQYGGRNSLPFAANNDAYIVRVDQVTTETQNGKQNWTLSLSVTESSFGNSMTEVTANGIGPDEIARRRAGRILVNDPPPIEDRRGYGPDSMIEGFIEGSMSKYPVRECVIRNVFKQYGRLPAWKEFARLKSLFFLKATATVEHVLELSLGTVRAGKISVKFRGQRPRKYSNVEPARIEITGVCPLN